MKSISKHLSLLRRAACAAALFAFALPLAAQVPQALNYQGRVAVNGAAFTGTGQFRFALVDGAGAVVWSSHASATVAVPVSEGLYSVRLGDTALPNMAAVPSALFSNADLRLRVWFNDGTNGLQQLAPDQRLAPVGYAHRAASVDSVPASAIAPGSIQPSHLAKSLQTGTATALASLPAAGGVLNVTFTQPFETPPAVTLGGLAVLPANVTTTGFSYTVPPRDLLVDDGSPPSSDVGRYCDAILVGGFPAIAYTDDTSGDLKYIRATNAQGSAWGAPVTAAVGGSAIVGDYCSLAMMGTIPAIAYYDRTSKDLKYVRANDATGTTWGAPVTVASHATDDLGRGCQLRYSIASVSLRRPVIAYLDATAGTVRVKVASDSNGSAWGAVQTPDPSLAGLTVDDIHTFDLFPSGNSLRLYYAHRVSSELRFTKANPSLSGWGIVDSDSIPDPYQTTGVSSVDAFPAAGGTTLTWTADGIGYSLRMGGDTWPLNTYGVPILTAAPGSSFAIVPGAIPSAVQHRGGGFQQFQALQPEGLSWERPHDFPGQHADSFPVALRLADGGVLAIHSFLNVAGTDRQLRVSGAQAPPSGVWEAILGTPLRAAGVADGSITRESLAPDFFGPGTRALSEGSLAVGSNSTAVGVSSWASGASTSALGQSSTAMGHVTKASGDFSTAMGYFTRASGVAATAMGYFTTASGLASTAMGRDTTASGTYSTAMGSATTASGTDSTAMGRVTTASGSASTAMGIVTTASGVAATAMGYLTTASGSYATAMGYLTTASGFASTAMGSATTASGVYSTAMGFATTAETYGETSLGFYPLLNTGDGDDFVTTDVLLEIGNGTSSAALSNALTMFKNGRIGLDNADTLAEVTHLLTLPNSASATGGQGRANAWTVYSDSRIKTEQRPLAYGLREIMRLQPRAYLQHAGCVQDGTFQCEDEDGGSAQTIGFIAQEVERVIPEAVQKPEDPANQLYGMDYEKLIPVLVKAAQELKTENDTLKTQLRAMETRLLRLEKPARKR